MYMIVSVIVYSTQKTFSKIMNLLINSELMTSHTGISIESHTDAVGEPDHGHFGFSSTCYRGAILGFNGSGTITFIRFQ